MNIHRHDHTPGAHGGHGAGIRGDNVWLNEEDIDIDDDIDLSGNDLIPPSYDLVPPSYEEAVGMPTPQAEAVIPVPPARTSHVEESDPLYQNVDSLTSDVR